MIPASPTPDFRSPDFLRAHVRDTLAFYLPRATDPAGGLFHFLRDDGTVYDRHTRHLVSSNRFVITCAMAQRLDPSEAHRQVLHQAFDFVQATAVAPSSLSDFGRGKRKSAPARPAFAGFAGP